MIIKDQMNIKKDRSDSTSSTGGHEITGAERFFASGGSGGVPVYYGGQGYEALANHH
jgi:hypothetical protein